VCALDCLTVRNGFQLISLNINLFLRRKGSVFRLTSIFFSKFFMMITSGLIQGGIFNRRVSRRIECFNLSWYREQGFTIRCDRFDELGGLTACLLMSPNRPQILHFLCTKSN
jgi:hypothetical protein